MFPHSPFSVFVISSLVALCSAATSAGCGKALPEGQTRGDSYQIPFTTTAVPHDRTYLIHIPSNYDINTAVPLIFSFHGHGKSSKGQETLSQFSNETWNPSGIAVYPQGTLNDDGESQWQGDPEAHDVDDIGFVQDMIDHFKDQYCIDTERIYATGKSNGGGFCHVMACDATMSKQIAAFAPVAGAYYVPGSTEADCAGHGAETIVIPCKPGRNPIPILEFHGNADMTAWYWGGPRKKACLPTVPHWVREWSKREGFGLTNKTTNLTDNKVHKYEYATNSANLGIVTHYLVENLTHAWPSEEPNSDSKVPSFINATPVIMDFFNKYSLTL